MRSLLPWAILTVSSLNSVSAVPSKRAPASTVQLDTATVTGVVSGDTTKFLGIPFAQPPVGDLRFRLPKPISAYNSSFKATAFKPACPQQKIELPIVSGLIGEVVDYVLNSVYGGIFPDDEDCLTLNVVKPATATPNSKLPVVFWIFGGGFQIGSPSLYEGANIVKRSISMGEPVIYVSLNYRLSGFGFLASKEVKDAGVGNLGLHDQREALRWVNKYISAFGGDPTKVTIWGESAGAISVGMHMLHNGGNTDGLFRAAFMQSGSPIPVGDITNGQRYYDNLVKDAGCASAPDTLQCLRTVSYPTLKRAVDRSPGIFEYQSLVLSWIPRADGVFLTDAPQKLLLDGKVARIPVVSGNLDDEGTLFSLSTLNITTNAQFRNYFAKQWFTPAALSEIDRLADVYPDSLLQGSPFDTGLFNVLSPQFKRMAALQGDAVFQAPRRFFMQQIADKQPTWGYLSKRNKKLPFLGSVHASDLLNIFLYGDMADPLIHFANHLDPNGKPGSRVNWPRYTNASPRLFTFLDGLFPTSVTLDNFRKEAISYITEMTLKYAL